MKKVFAELIAGLIPQKMARNRWRGILRYGVWKSLKLKKELKCQRSEPRHYLSVCAIAKDEGEYFKEWLDWHIEKGVEKFYIYDNGSQDGTYRTLSPYIDSGIVEYRYFPGNRKQIAAYDECIERHRFETKWLAFIDLDEFIVPVADSTIPEFLRRFENAAAVEINWLVYGSGGQILKSDLPVMLRFKAHSLPTHALNRHVKSIVNTRHTYNMIGCHEAARIAGYKMDSHGNVIKKNFREREPQHDVIRINHYAVKSREEFAEKKLRGRASGKRREIAEGYFKLYDLNDIEELPS